MKRHSALGLKGIHTCYPLVVVWVIPTALSALLANSAEACTLSPFHDNTSFNFSGFQTPRCPVFALTARHMK